MIKVLLTGGGTAGHVTPNIALIPYLQEKGFSIEYMGSYDGIEKELIEKEGIPYTGIDSGKLRRYLSVQNLKDPAHILRGIREAKAYMKENRPDVVFSKGGYVAVPVIYAAASYKIPIVIHESDLTPGLANKLCISKAKKICFNFPETESYLKGKGVHTGLPIRRQLLEGSAEKGMIACNFSSNKPVLMVIGGSLGSLNVNNAVRSVLPQLLEKFQIVHICGAGKMDESLKGTRGYQQFEYVNEGLNDLMAMSDIVISRAGANVICEIQALGKPAILIPLGTDASRGDQILNARSFEKRGFSYVLTEDNLSDDALLEAVNYVFENRDQYIEAMKAAAEEDAAALVASIIASMVPEKEEAPAEEEKAPECEEPACEEPAEETAEAASEAEEYAEEEVAEALNEEPAADIKEESEETSGLSMTEDQLLEAYRVLKEKGITADSMSEEEFKNIVNELFTNAR